MRTNRISRYTVLSIVGLFLWAAHAQGVEKHQSPPLAFARVNVIDTLAGSTKPDMTVIVKRGQITLVGKADEVGIPKDAKVIDGAGKYIIPGLWDMHTHWYETEYLPLTRFAA